MTETLAPSPGTDSRFAGRSVAEIAAALPGATAVFRRRKLDFCCGGQAKLTEAAAAQGLPLAEIEAELAALATGATAPPQDTDALIELIETRYHATHRRELPELIRLAGRVETVHRNHPDAPHGLAQLLTEMAEELESHMAKEEQVLFPLMRRGGHPMIAHPIGAMRAEHDSHDAQLLRLGALTRDGAIPHGACATWKALYAGTRKLAEDLTAHIHLENTVLFPRFGA
jgi:regulator of cell morphogenesis and NO signaling